MSDCTDEKMEKIKEKLSSLLFELITDIPSPCTPPPRSRTTRLTN